MNGYGLNVYKFSVDKYVSELYTDEQFKEEILSGIGEQERMVMAQCFHAMNENIDKLIRENNRGGLEL
ncbi:MAG: hypothetical protein IKI93_11580 [Clostridia bacterium]|nr:hypothetical protein [Clostridia bacterium]